MRIKHLVQKSFQTTHPHAGINSIEKRLRDNSFLVVLDDSSFLGILTPSDIIESPHQLVIDCLHDKPRLRLEQDIESVLMLMKEGRSYVLPVFKGDKFVGVVTQESITDYLFEYRNDLQGAISAHTAELNDINQELKREIEERSRAEEALRESEARYRELVENANSIILRRDTRGNITFFNEFAQRFFGYTKDEILGKNVIGTIVPETDSAGRDLAAMIRDIGLYPERYVNNENENMRRNGERVWVAWTNRAIHDKDGNIVEILGVGNDVTERKRLQSKLRQAQKMEAIGTLAGGIAHDFNNLLMAILGNVSLMLWETDPADRNYDRLKGIEKQVESGSRLTTQLLGYARKGKYEVKPIDLNQLVEDSSEAFSRTRKRIRIEAQLSDDLFSIQADQGQVEQVLWNLYVNAADAMPDGGDLILKTANTSQSSMREKFHDPAPGNYVLLTVTDTGVGMDRETMERIFDPFFTTKEVDRGTGLGLASVYGITRAHGGYIDVASTKGHGTTFSIYLPASQKKVQTHIKTSDEVVEGKGTVLMVDDEEAVVEVGRNLLEALGYQVLVARSGQEAIDVYRRNRNDIDIVVLDVVMPGIGGGEVYDSMKEINPDIKVLLSSGISIEGEATQILRRGCNGFIQKPFSLNGLSGKIRKILDTK